MIVEVTAAFNKDISKLRDKKLIMAIKTPCSKLKKQII